MRKIVLLLSIFFVLKTSAQITFAGFDLPICASPMTNVYSYNNYAVGFHGDGYNIYKNGTLIYNLFGQYSAEVWCFDLVAINDSTVFMVQGDAGNYIVVYKTVDYGQSWINMGGAATWGYLGLYIINQNYGYLITHPSPVIVTKVTDLYPASTLLMDTTVTSDKYKNDTILNQSLCNIDSLKIFIKNGVDTVTYHINFHITLAGIDNYDVENKLTLSPNPATTFFTITTTATKIKEVKVFNVFGELVFHTEIHNNQSTINSSQFSKGIYFVQITNEKGSVANRKVVVQ